MKDGERLVVSVGDSFSSGTVSLPLHFTSIAERELEGISIYNMGAPALGPAEYAHLLVSEALPMEPACIVVQLFVGNDLDAVAPVAQTRRGPALLFDGERHAVVRFTQRLLRLSAERRRAEAEGAGGGIVQGEQIAGLVSSVEEAIERHPWYADPMLERPTFSAQGYRTLEAKRAAEIASEGRGSYGALSILEQLVAAAGDVPVVFALIPDEFQVEDEVWEAVRADHTEPLERDRPQRILREWASARGIPVLDYLPALRAVSPLADGRRHVYHFQDSHWNARGNEAAGRELARFLRELDG